jgi:hypothetical protein
MCPLSYGTLSPWGLGWFCRPRSLKRGCVADIGPDADQLIGFGTNGDALFIHMTGESQRVNRRPGMVGSPIVSTEGTVDDQ